MSFHTVSGIGCRPLSAWERPQWCGKATSPGTRGGDADAPAAVIVHLRRLALLFGQVKAIEARVQPQHPRLLYPDHFMLRHARTNKFKDREMEILVLSPTEFIVSAVAGLGIFRPAMSEIVFAISGANIVPGVRPIVN